MGIEWAWPALSMKNLTDPKWIKIKGGLFLILGCLAVAMLFVDDPTLKTAVFLLVAIWSFCRFYYFAFYVIEHYIDASYRFNGLWSFFRYIARRERPGP